MRAYSVHGSLAFFAFLWLVLLETSAAQSSISNVSDIPDTLRLEAEASVRRGIDYLISMQSSNGSWQNSVRNTALACVAITESGLAKPETPPLASLVRARRFLLKNVREDGSIVGADDLVSADHETAFALLAFLSMNHADDLSIIRSACRYIVGSRPLMSNDSKDNFLDVDLYGMPKLRQLIFSRTWWELEALYVKSCCRRGGDEDYRHDCEKAYRAWKSALESTSGAPKTSIKPECEDTTDKNPINDEMIDSRLAVVKRCLKTQRGDGAWPHVTDGSRGKLVIFATCLNLIKLEAIFLL